MSLIPVEKRTVFAPNGDSDMGVVTTEIAATIGCRAGSIRLLRGIEGRAGGFGLAHILANDGREERIRGLGFLTIEHYVRRVATAYDFVGVQDDGRLVLILDHAGCFNHLICQWDEELGVWSVTTAIPKRNMRGVKVMWDRKGVNAA
jgi:hypothetical protein